MQENYFLASCMEMWNNHNYSATKHSYPSVTKAYLRNRYMYICTCSCQIACRMEGSQAGDQTMDWVQFWSPDNMRTIIHSDVSSKHKHLSGIQHPQPWDWWVRGCKVSVGKNGTLLIFTRVCVLTHSGTGLQKWKFCWYIVALVNAILSNPSTEGSARWSSLVWHIHAMQK